MGRYASNMSQTLALISFVLFLLILTGCSVIDVSDSKANVCSADWYALVENQVLTSDDHGHGPDVGSNEWRSVVEFKLGVRGDKKNPPIESDQWCKYINNNYIDKTA